jgi:REP element-mobilizing transposase RayT
MRSRYKVKDSEYPYFVTSTCVDWIPIFTNEGYAELLLKNISFYQAEYEMIIAAYVIMPEHFHMIASCNQLSKSLQSLKSYTAKKFLEMLGKEEDQNTLKRLKASKALHKTESEFQFWQEGFHPKQISNNLILRQKIEYIHMNPVERGLVERAEDWKFSSADFYANGKQTDIEIARYI